MSTYEDTDARDLDLYNASRVVAHKPEPERYSDEWLDAEIAAGMDRGTINSAPYLRKLDTVARRSRAVSEAYTLGNVVGGRFSGNVYAAVNALLRAIENGTEDERLYGENFAHTAREREQELRQVTGNPNAIYNPFH